MNSCNRIDSFDFLRGIAIILILLFHSSIYNFANIHKLDFSNPPLIVVLISFMGLWGGVFIVYSTALNTYKSGDFLNRKPGFRPFSYLVIAGIIYLAVNYLLNFFLGRWNVDFVNNNPVLTSSAYFFRNFSFTAPKIIKLFDGSSVGTIGFNLIATSIILYLLSVKGTKHREGKIYTSIMIAAILIMLVSFTKVYLYPLFASHIEHGHYFTSLILSYLLSNPYPLLPYFAYGLFGMIIGLMIHEGKEALLKKTIIPTGLFFVIYGLAGMTQFEKTISKPDFFWYFKTNFELGVFLLLFVLSRFVPGPGSIFIKKLPVIRWFSRVSLTVYLCETTTSEIIRIPWLRLFPGWNETINGCLLFGVVNIIFWCVILFFWKRAGFRYSFEYFWSEGFRLLGKRSTKLDFN